MHLRYFSSRRSNPRVAMALMIVLAMLASSTLPALAGTVDEFTSGGTEVTLTMEPYLPENTTAIGFPSDSKVRDASVTLRGDVSPRRADLVADGGNVSAWAYTGESLDMRAMEVEGLKETPFTEGDLIKVALNSTASYKTTVDSNVSAHLFAFNVSNVLGGADRDLSMTLGWTGMGVQQGTISSDAVSLYIADFVRDRWVLWDQTHVTPSTGELRHFATTLGPYAGWTSEDGNMYFLATVSPQNPGGGTTITTSHVLLQLRYAPVPHMLDVNVGDEPVPVFDWRDAVTGDYGMQNVFESGSVVEQAQFMTETEHMNFSSFLVPQGADIVGAQLALSGIPGEMQTATPMERTAYVDAYGWSTNTRVEDIPSYHNPVWGQVVLKGLKNAGQRDQSQESATTGQIIGNYGAGSRSIAQSFVPAISGTLVFINVSLEGAVYVNAPNISVEIRTTNATGHPTTTVVGSSLINGSIVNQSSAMWFTVNFEDVDLSAGTEYAIVLTVPTAMSGQTFEWKNHFLTSGDPYPGGTTLVSDTPDGSGPWAAIANTDQAFITFMETDIGAGVNLVKVSGVAFDSVRQGPTGDEYVFNITRGVTSDEGKWVFAVTNANPFPVSFNWTATVFSEVYTQAFGLKLSTDTGDEAFYSYIGNNISLSGIRWLTFTDELEGLIAGATANYTSANGLPFVRVNLTARGEVTGTMLVSGLRVRYLLDVEITGPAVVAAADAYRAAYAVNGSVEVPFIVWSEAAATVTLADPSLVYDLMPTFTPATQVMEEDTGKVLNLTTLYGDDYDNDALVYEVVSVSEPTALTADLNGSMLNLTPAADFFGELDVTVRGTDSSGQHRDGTFHVVVQAVNDAPTIEDIGAVAAQAKLTKVLDLSSNISDVDNAPEELTVEVDSSFITVEGMKLYATFDSQGTYDVGLTVSDGELQATATITFEVSPAVGFPSITGLPQEIVVHINRPLPMNLTQFGSDDEDAPGDLVWVVTEESDLFDVSQDASGHKLTITPTGVGMGVDDMFLSLTDSDDHTVTVTVDVNITERLLEAPRINHDTLPDKMKLTKGGASEVIDLRDHVEDETPIVELQVTVAYTVEDVVYVDSQAGTGRLTFVPQGVGKTKVTVTLTDSDDKSSFFEVDVDVSEGDEDDEVNWTLWIIVLIILVLIVVLVAWPRKAPGEAPPPRIVGEEPAVTAKRVEKVKPHTFRSSSFKQLEEVLLFHSSGLLISQYTREIKEGVDADLESAVIAAVQESIRGKMRTREEPTDVIELEGMQVVIERGADVAIAAVLSGAIPEGLRKQLRRSLSEVQTRNEQALKDWDGDLGELRGVDNAMVGLVEGLIREHNGSQDLAVDGAVVGRAQRAAPAVEGVPPLEDEEEPLKLIKDIIGEEKTKELEEGHHEEGPSEEPEEEPSEEGEGER